VLIGHGEQVRDRGRTDAFNLIGNRQAVAELDRS
jgi:hypothetical protein